MGATLHRLLMTLGSIAAGIGGVMAIPGADVVGIPAAVGAWAAITAALCILVANSIRTYFPDVEPNTTKTTLETTTGEVTT